MQVFQSLFLHPTFFAPIIQYVALASGDSVTFETRDNFQKQTYRNRCYIFGANGRQLLSVPIVHAHGKGRQKTREMKIDNSFRRTAGASTSPGNPVTVMKPLEVAAAMIRRSASLRPFDGPANRLEMSITGMW